MLKIQIKQMIKKLVIIPRMMMFLIAIMTLTINKKVEKVRMEMDKIVVPMTNKKKIMTAKARLKRTNHCLLENNFFKETCIIFILQLIDESGLTIAKMDATANDVPKPYEVQG
jgi:hypothetical protein